MQRINTRFVMIGRSEVIDLVAGNGAALQSIRANSGLVAQIRYCARCEPPVNIRLREYIKQKKLLAAVSTIRSPQPPDIGRQLRVGGFAGRQALQQLLVKSPRAGR